MRYKSLAHIYAFEFAHIHHYIQIHLQNKRAHKKHTKLDTGI